jgi:hypothetical protein
MPKSVNVFHKESKGILLRVINQIPKLFFYRHQVAVIVGYGPEFSAPTFLRSLVRTMLKSWIKNHGNLGIMSLHNNS